MSPKFIINLGNTFYGPRAVEKDIILQQDLLIGKGNCFRHFILLKVSSLIKCSFDTHFHSKNILYHVSSKAVIISRGCHHLLTHCSLVMPNASYNFVNICLGNDLVPYGTKPLPEQILSYHQWSLLAFTREQFQWKCVSYLSLLWDQKLLI